MFFSGPHGSDAVAVAAAVRSGDAHEVMVGPFFREVHSGVITDMDFVSETLVFLDEV